MALPNLPEPWLTAAVNANVRGSVRGIAEKTQLSPETVRRLVHGIGESENDTVARVAEHLRVPVATVREWSGRAELRDPFVLPARANQLNPDQRAAVLGVVSAFLGEPVAAPRPERGANHEHLTASMYQAGESPAALDVTDEQDVPAPAAPATGAKRRSPRGAQA